MLYVLEPDDVGAVGCLIADMEEEAQIPPVTTLSDSSEEVAPPPAPAHGIKRKRDKGDGSKKKPSSDDVVRIQCMLGKKGHCKKNCKHHFRGKQGFEELRQFRREWSQLHKTDQDEVVPYSLPVHVFFGWSIWEGQWFASSLM